MIYYSYPEILDLEFFYFWKFHIYSLLRKYSDQIKAKTALFHFHKWATKRVQNRLGILEYEAQED